MKKTYITPSALCRYITPLTVLCTSPSTPTISGGVVTLGMVAVRPSVPCSDICHPSLTLIPLSLP